MDELEIQIQKRKTIKPSTPTPNNNRSLKISFFDQCTPPTYVSVLLHYLPSNIELNNREDSTVVVERCGKVEKSLSEMLTKFYPLAGRFREDGLSIECNDEGVEYAETKINMDLAEFLDQAGAKVELLSDLLVFDTKNMHQCSSPLFGVQVNIFNCGGLVLGIQISHALADAFTLATILNEWAHVSKTGITQGCHSNFGHLSSLYPTRVLPKSSNDHSLFNSSAKVVSKRFVFDALAIKELRDRIDSSMKPSRVVIILSLIWKVLVGISSARHGRRSRNSYYLGIPINLRPKFKEPLIERALGNFILSKVATLETNQSTEHQLNDFVNLVGTTLRGAFLNIDKASVDDIIASTSLGAVGENFYYSSSWCKFPWYEVDFGWGKPFWVSGIASTIDKLIWLIDSKDGDGIEAWVCLEENDMSEFERDLDILTFSPPQKQQLIP